MVSMKGRHTVRANTPNGREPRHIEPWIFEPKENSTLSRLEKVYLDALEAVDSLEARKVRATQGGTLTPAGIASDMLGFAASELAPKLLKARRAVEQAKAEVVARREGLVLKPADKTDAAGQMRRLWKLDKFNSLPDAERNALVADVSTLDPELAQAFLEAPQQAKILPSSLRQIHDHALRAQHGEGTFAELADLEAGIKIADTTIAAAREEIAFEVGGTAKVDEAAKPFEKMAGAPWLRKFGDELGASTLRATKAIGIPRVRTRLRMASTLRAPTNGAWPRAGLSRNI